MFLRKLFKSFPQAPILQAVDLINRGDYAGALPRLTALLDSQEVAVREKARLYACEAHLLLGDQMAPTDPTGALRHYATASSLQPRFADIHNKVGETSQRLGQLSEAERAYRRALDINPRYVAARLSLAEICVRQGHQEDALEELQRLEEFCPPLHRELLHDLIHSCQQGQALDLVENFGEIRKLIPTRLEVARQASLEAIRRGEPALAARILHDLVQEHPNFPDLHNLLGLAYGELDKLDRAISEFQAALSINPKFLKARINLGISLMEQGRVEEARSELERALELDPSNPLVESALAELSAARIGS